MPLNLRAALGGVNPWVLGAGVAGASVLASSGAQSTLGSLGSIIQLAPYLLVGGLGVYALQVLK